MRAKSLIMALIMVIVLTIPANVKATDNSYQDYFKLLSQPRYLDTDNYGTYEIRLNKMYQTKADGTEKLVLDMGFGTTATDNKTGMTIADFRSFYVTDATNGYLSGNEYVIIAGLVLVPHPQYKSMGIPADVVMAYEPSTGSTRTLFVNIRYPISVSEDQYNMKESALYEYLQWDILFPRVTISKDESSSVFVLSGAADLSYVNPSNRIELETRGYNGDFFELIKIKDAMNTASIESCFSGSLTIFDKEHNPNFKIPALKGKTHDIDRHLIVFKEDSNTKGQINIASVGTDASDFCTAVAINIVTQPEDEYYWIERGKFFELMGLPNTTKTTPPSNGIGGSEKEWLESKNAQTSPSTAPVATSAPQTNQNESTQMRAPQTFNMTSREAEELPMKPSIPSSYPPVIFKKEYKDLAGVEYIQNASIVDNPEDKYSPLGLTIVKFDIPNYINNDHSNRIYYPTDIYVNGVYACTTGSWGNASVRLYPGVVYEITCKAIGYYDSKLKTHLNQAYHDETFLIKTPGFPNSLYLDVKMYPKSGTKPQPKILNITSDPVGADVYYDGMYFGTTPTTIPVKTSGARIELELQGYQSIQMDILTGNGKKFVDGDTLHYELISEKP